MSGAHHHRQDHHGHGHHHHGHGTGGSNHGPAFAVAIALNTLFVVAEVAASFVSGSTALLADAGHNLGDVLALLLAWGASILAARPAGPGFTYGLKSSSILAAIANAALLWVALGAILFESVQRLWEPAQVNGGQVMIVAGVGIGINLVSALLFARGSRSDLNLRAAFMHLIADAVVSASVVLAGLAIVLTGMNWIDPVTSLVITLGLLYRNSKQQRIISEKDSKLKADRIAFLESQQQVVSLQSMINGQEMERTRIAKDLHDGLGGLFSTLKMYFSTLLHDRQELEAEPLMKKSGELIQMASEEVRRIAHNMMPEVLLKIGLVQGVRELCAAISAGRLLQVSFQAYGMDRRLDGPTEVMLYRILQELLNNIMKHAQATEAIVQFNRNGQALNITVEDNGKGFKPGAREGYRHSGLDSVYSRVQSLKGQMTIESRQQMGTTVMMEFRIAEDPVT